jgi:hypothetical protein
MLRGYIAAIINQRALRIANNPAAIYRGHHQSTCPSHREQSRGDISRSASINGDLRIAINPAAIQRDD